MNDLIEPVVDPLVDRRCVHMDACPMFGLFQLAGTLSVWKVRYCTAAYETCERHRRACAGESIPQNLLPNGQLLRKVT